MNEETTTPPGRPVHLRYNKGCLEYHAFGRANTRLRVVCAILLHAFALHALSPSITTSTESEVRVNTQPQLRFTPFFSHIVSFSISLPRSLSPLTFFRTPKMGDGDFDPKPCLGYLSWYPLSNADEVRPDEHESNTQQPFQRVGVH